MIAFLKSCLGIAFLSLLGLVVLVFVLFRKSTHCEKINLSLEDKQWYQAYAKCDTIWFKSNKGKLDTLIISSRDNRYSPCNKFELSTHIFQEMNIKMIPPFCPEDESYCRVEISLSKRYQYKPDETCEKIISVFDLNSNFKETDSLIKMDSIHLNGFVGKILTYYFEKDDRFSQSYGWMKIKSFNWSKEFGLVRYNRNNEIFELYRN